MHFEILVEDASGKTVSAVPGKFLLMLYIPGDLLH